ncbi:MAG: pyrroloquinoline quinone biosynthesis protein PqqE [Citromicrobium sp.]|nr:pyrroloquinoline quinone biosynthesis protein PqqE [Citromicrobium sp.]
MNLVLATDDTGGPEIFASVQGEGPSSGEPTAFVRLSRCNLACVWCDTAYTWHFEGDERPHRSGETFDRKANQVTLEVEDVAARIAALGRLRPMKTVCEPMLQAAGLAQLLAALPDMTVEIETNGTAFPPPKLEVWVDQFNISPKLTHSGNARELAIVPGVLRRYASDGRAFFKFVVAEPADVEEVREVVRANALPRGRVFLMAEGTDGATLRARQEWLVPLCLEHGFRLSDRLHIHLFGDTRGT